VSLTVEDEDGERVVMDVADTSVDANPAEHLTRAERIAEVRRAIEDLPPAERDIIMLKDIQGLSYAQIADLLSVEEGTVGSRLSRARKNLEKILKTRNIF
jgi:RNA polymerase sigma-70 factor (ECF subfamily)